MKQILIAVVVLLAAACGSASSQTAKKSDVVTLLSHDAWAASPQVIADFTKETGYKIKFIKPGDVGVLVNQAILTKNHPVADALYGIDNTFLTRAFDNKLFDPYTARGSGAIPADVGTDPQHRVTPIDTGDVCVNYDNTWFGKQGRPPAPTSFASLVDPRYKNLAVVENAATSSPGLAFLLGTFSVPGGDWHNYWRKLRANGVRVDNDWTQAYDTDFTAGGANGDRPIVVSYASSPPADIVYSDPHRDVSHVSVVPSTCFRQTEYAGVLRHAKNPAGARALIDFLVSREFQADMPLQMYVNPVVPGTPIPAVYRDNTATPDPVHSMSSDAIGAGRDQWIKEWTDIVLH